MPPLPPPPPWLQIRPTQTTLAIHLQPRASRNEVVGERGGLLRVRVTAPPVDAAANQALLDLLADRLGCARNQIALIRGHTSRQKTVAVRGLSAETIVRHLSP